MSPEELKELTLSEDVTERAFGIYMMSTRRLTTEKHIAAEVGVSIHTLKEWIHRGVGRIGDGTPWRVLRQNLQQEQAKELLKDALPGMSRAAASGVAVLETIIDQISQAVAAGQYMPSDLPTVATKLVGAIERLVKIKRLEVGESTQNVDVHSKQTNGTSLADADRLLGGNFIEASSDPSN